MIGYFVFNTYLGYASLALQIGVVALLVVYLFRNRVALFRTIAEYFGDNGLWIGFALSLAGTLLSLYYSNVLEVPPCDLCWWQRIFLYPQVILLGLAMRKRDAYMADNVLILSVFGAAVALYNHVLQMYPNALPCPATGVSCAQRFMFEMNYITLPLTSFALFAALILIMLFVRMRRE